MKLPSLFVALAFVVLASPAWSAEEEPAKEKKGKPASAEKRGPGLLGRMWQKVVPAKKEAAPDKETGAVDRAVGKNKLRLSMALEPLPLKLSDTRQLKVSLRVANRMGHLVQLEFPTTQRIEVLVHDASGKLVEQWSEDRNFENQPGMVSINPGEHLEYSATIATRDMTAGGTYTIEALFPQYEGLRLQKKITAEK